MRTDEFDYTLPPELIAQEPTPQRTGSRLMVLERQGQSIRHDRFDRIGDYLRSGDLLVANRTRVIPARLQARRPSGGAVEILLVRERARGCWEALARPSRKLRDGMELRIEESELQAVIEHRLDEGLWLVRLEGADDVDSEIRRVGRLPLPPYIRNPNAPLDRYQTVFADHEGSVAAPTAGLHFTDDLFASLLGQGIRTEFVTLHVGIGTFKPVTVDRVEEHRMHAEWGEVPPQVADAVNTTRESGGRVVAIGTTTTRLLESAACGIRVEPFQDETDRFIYPGYRFQAIDALVTNFHLPRSTLLMLVSAFAGRDFVLGAYAEAVRERYRFYSFGDAMLIL